MYTARQVIEHAIEDGLFADFASDYAEPGYSYPAVGILFANWNAEYHYDQATNTSSTTPTLMSRLAKVAERAGYACEWSDEWTTCSNCYRAVRTSPDSYSWQPSYHESDGEITCSDCIDPVTYLEELEGDSSKAVTFDHIDPADHGYIQAKGNMSNGWYPGQNDSPEVVAKELRAKGINRFLFRIDSVGQFDLDFSVYVHEDETDLLTAEPKSSLPYDPGTEMGKAMRGEPTPHYHMTSRTLTPEEFVSGSWCKD